MWPKFALLYQASSLVQCTLPSPWGTLISLNDCGWVVTQKCKHSSFMWWLWTIVSTSEYTFRIVTYCRVLEFSSYFNWALCSTVNEGWQIFFQIFRSLHLLCQLFTAFWVLQTIGNMKKTLWIMVNTLAWGLICCTLSMARWWAVGSRTEISYIFWVAVGKAAFICKWKPQYTLPHPYDIKSVGVNQEFPWLVVHRHLILFNFVCLKGLQLRLIDTVTTLLW
jgi:hypothetical protein